MARGGVGGHRGRAVRRAADLHALPAARVPRGRARARARDQGDGGAARAARPALPGLPRRGRSVLPRLPRLYDAAQAVVLELQGAARGAVADLPVLRDTDRAGLDAGAAAAPDAAPGAPPSLGVAAWPRSGRSS